MGEEIDRHAYRLQKRLTLTPTNSAPNIPSQMNFGDTVQLQQQIALG
jgi:hypothetical protein